MIEARHSAVHRPPIIGIKLHEQADRKASELGKALRRAHALCLRLERGEPGAIADERRERAAPESSSSLAFRLSILLVLQWFSSR